MSEADYKRRVIDHARKMAEANCLVIDTETTGLGADDVIVEIAIVDVAETLEFSALIKFDHPIPEAATKVHGITDTMVGRATSRWVIWQAIRPILDNRYLLAYNAPFDSQMFRQTFGESHCRHLEWSCLMNMWSEFHGLKRWARLENVCYEIGVPVGGHRALGDAKAAREVLRWLARREI